MAGSHPEDQPQAALLSTGDIARRLCMTPEAVRKWTHQPDFPQPRATVGVFRLWDADEVAEWTAVSGHPQRIHRSRWLRDARQLPVEQRADLIAALLRNVGLADENAP